MIAAVCVNWSVVGLFGRSDLWLRAFADSVPAKLRDKGDASPGKWSNYQTLKVSRGGIALNRLYQVSPAGTPGTFAVQDDDGVMVRVALGSNQIGHNGSWSGNYPRVAVSRSERLYGFRWMGLTWNIDEGLEAVVLPLPTIALAAGAWPATAAWRWWRRRRRGELAGGFEVIPRPTEEPGSDEPRHDVP